MNGRWSNDLPGPQQRWLAKLTVFFTALPKREKPGQRASRLDPLDNDARSQKEKTASHYDRGSTPGGIENPLLSPVSTKGPAQLAMQWMGLECRILNLGRWIKKLKRATATRARGARSAATAAGLQLAARRRSAPPLARASPPVSSVAGPPSCRILIAGPSCLRRR